MTPREWEDRAEACSDGADHAEMCAGETMGHERQAYKWLADLLRKYETGCTRRAAVALRVAAEMEGD